MTSMAMPICNKCKHLGEYPTRCAAFTEIPQDILDNKFIHDKLYIDQENQFTFEAVDAEAQEYYEFIKHI